MYDCACFWLCMSTCPDLFVVVYFLWSTCHSKPAVTYLWVILGHLNEKISADRDDCGRVEKKEEEINEGIDINCLIEKTH